jgi:hypothetical protein
LIGFSYEERCNRKKDQLEVKKIYEISAEFDIQKNIFNVRRVRESNGIAFFDDSKDADIK